MRHDSIREHVDAQRGSRRDDDAGGHRNLAETAVGPLSAGHGLQVLQGGGARCHLLSGGWGDEHPHRDRCQPNTSWDVEELFP